MRALTIASGILMIATAAFCFINPGQTFMTMAFVVGAVMVVCGIIHTASYLVSRNQNGRGDNNGWIFIDAMLTLLLGILILANQLTVDIAIPMIFGMWVLVAGLLRIEAATRIDRKKKPGNFKATLITGIITTIIGLFGFVNPLVTYVSVVLLLGLFMLIYGIDTIELGINMPHEPKERIVKHTRDMVKIVDEEDETEEAVAERVRARNKAITERNYVEAIATEQIGLTREEAKEAIEAVKQQEEGE